MTQLGKQKTALREKENLPKSWPDLYAAIKRDLAVKINQLLFSLGIKGVTQRMQGECRDSAVSHFLI